MSENRRISWLASYPKSGSTWVRCFLRAYQFDAYEPININQIGRISMSDSRVSQFEAVANRPNAQLTDQDVNALRAAVQQRIAAALGKHQVVKTHNARVLVDGIPIICNEYSQRAVYIVRNPLDIVDSLADHTGTNHERAIQSMNDPLFTFGGPDMKFVRQYLTQWSNHFHTWSVDVPYPVLVLRYEDLLATPEKKFSELIGFLGWMFDGDRLQRAIRFSSFDVLKASEQSVGFKETSHASLSRNFFRRGQAGKWRSILSRENQLQIIADHGPAMQRLGYL